MHAVCWNVPANNVAVLVCTLKWNVHYSSFRCSQPLFESSKLQLRLLETFVRVLHKKKLCTLFLRWFLNIALRILNYAYGVSMFTNQGHPTSIFGNPKKFHSVTKEPYSQNHVASLVTTFQSTTLPQTLTPLTLPQVRILPLVCTLKSAV